MKMAAPGLCHLFALFLITLYHTSHSSEIPSENAKQSMTRSSTSNTDSKPDPDMGLLGDSHRRRHWSRKESDNGGLLSRRPVDRPEDDGTSLEGLSPVRLEMGPGDSMRVEVHDEVRGPTHMLREVIHQRESSIVKAGDVAMGIWLSTESREAKETKVTLKVIKIFFTF